MIAGYSYDNCDLPIRFETPKVTNEDRRQIAAESRQKLRVSTAQTPRLLHGNSPNLYTMLPDYCHLIF